MSLSQKTANLLTHMHEVQGVVGTLSGPQAGQIAQRVRELTFEAEVLYDEVGLLETTVSLLAGIIRSRDAGKAVESSAALIQSWAHVEAVGVRLREGDDYPYFTTIGFPDAFVKMENRLAAFDEHGHRIRNRDGSLVLECMCGNVISGDFDPGKSFFTKRGSFWTNSTTELLDKNTEEDLGRTRNHCHREGYESVALIPLASGDETFGLIQLNDHRRNRFNAEMITRLELFADYIAATLA
jgi:hypothetical protein